MRHRAASEIKLKRIWVTRIFFLSFFNCLSFCTVSDQLQGLVCARQVLYHQATPPSSKRKVGIKSMMRSHGLKRYMEGSESQVWWSLLWNPKTISTDLWDILCARPVANPSEAADGQISEVLLTSRQTDLGLVTTSEPSGCCSLEAQRQLLGMG